MSDTGDKRKGTYWLPLIAGAVMVILSLIFKQPSGSRPFPVFYLLGAQMAMFRYISVLWIWKLSRLQNRSPLSNVILAAFFPAIMLIVQGAKGDGDKEGHPVPFEGESVSLLKKVGLISLAIVLINWTFSLLVFPIGPNIPSTKFLPVILEVYLYWGVYFLLGFPMISLILALPFAAIPFKEFPYSSKVVRIALYVFLVLNIAHLIVTLLFPFGVLPLNG